MLNITCKCLEINYLSVKIEVIYNYLLYKMVEKEIKSYVYSIYNLLIFNLFPYLLFSFILVVGIREFRVYVLNLYLLQHSQEYLLIYVFTEKHHCQINTCKTISNRLSVKRLAVI